MFSARQVMRLGVLAVALVGCGGNQPTTTNVLITSTPRAGPTGELTQFGQITYANWGGRRASGMATFDLDAGDFYFKGTFIQGEPGQTLTLQIRNVAGQVHNFSLPAQGLDRDIPLLGARINVDVTYPESGTVQFFCKYHTARGMNGQLLVGNAMPEPMASPSLDASPQPAR
jgi:plastocyanin